MKAGALDAYISPVKMKKGRLGTLLCVMAELKDKDMVLSRIFEQTTTLGVRVYLVKRQKLSRKMGKVKVRSGTIKVKIGMIGETIKNISPEYEDCAKISKRTGIPLKRIYDEAKSEAMRSF
jgi:uncharacterized protein (DUF111 family)